MKVRDSKYAQIFGSPDYNIITKSKNKVFFLLVKRLHKIYFSCKHLYKTKNQICLLITRVGSMWLGNSGWNFSCSTYQNVSSNNTYFSACPKKYPMKGPKVQISTNDFVTLLKGLFRKPALMVKIYKWQKYVDLK